MCAKPRKSIRYNVIARVESKELSVFPGTILDLSSQGCKIHYSNPVAVSLEKEYPILIKLSGVQDIDNMSLICQPVWVNEDSGATNIGMQFLHSPDTDLLNKYISILHQQSLEKDSITSQIVENKCQFI